MVQFAKEMCELQKQQIAKTMENVVYDDRIGNMSYKSVNDAILNTPKYMSIEELLNNFGKDIYDSQIDVPLTMEEIEEYLREFGKQICDLQIEKCKEDVTPEIIWNDNPSFGERLYASSDPPFHLTYSRDDIGNIDGYYEAVVKLETKNICEI